MAPTVLMPQINLDKWLEQRLSTSCQRQLLVIHGDRLWACRQAKIILSRLTFDDLLWVGQEEGKGQQISSKQYHQHLGREYQAVVYDCYEGMRANALGALSGTIIQGGLMILICPPLGDWADFNDPQKIERISYGFTHLAKHSQFVEFLIGQIHTDDSVLQLSADSFKGSNALLASLTDTARPPYRSQEQQILVENLVQLVHGKAAKPMLVTADRGRGKSSALGIAAALMLLQGIKRVLVCAPTFSAVERLFFHARESLVGAKLQHHSLRFADSSIDFHPIDRILSELPHADLLMVDEAAAIPPPLLQKLTQVYSKLVFSSTIHGYEGSGRGFELRFKPYLQANFPNLVQQHIEQPIRWQQGDPLESFWFRSLLLKSEPVAVRYDEDQPCQFELVPQSRLIKEPDLLNQVFSLLVNSHYQTSPDDLVRLLDAPEQLLFILRQENHLLGAALTHIEGAGKLDELAREISEGKRRVRGHMLPQSLGLHLSLEQAVSMHYLRIVRIAVASDYQRMGLGKYLLSQLNNYAQAKGFDFLGSSFGATRELLKFWTDADYQFVRLGHRKDAASGEYSAIVVKALSEQAMTVKAQLLIHLAEQQNQSPERFSPLL